jgi:hypothetical protein
VSFLDYGLIRTRTTQHLLERCLLLLRLVAYSSALYSSYRLKYLTQPAAMADELAPPRKSTELEDSGTKDLGTSHTSPQSHMPD